MTLELMPGERLDDLQTGGLHIIQNPERFCFGTDSVLLADFASPKKKDRAIDLGSGNGAIALLLAAHCPSVQVDAVEIQADMAEMAQRSVKLNELEARIRVYHMDMRSAVQALGRERYSLAVCNPPYFALGCAPVSPSPSARIARHEETLTIAEMAHSASALLKFGGRLCVVYPAPRAFEMMSAMHAARLAPKRIRCIQSSPLRAPKLVLLECVKGGGASLHWLPPLLIKREDGSYSDEWRRIYGL